LDWLGHASPTTWSLEERCTALTSPSAKVGVAVDPNRRLDPMFEQHSADVRCLGRVEMARIRRHVARRAFLANRAFRTIAALKTSDIFWLLSTWSHFILANSESAQVPRKSLAR
jgi:hypothetical protein